MTADPTFWNKIAEEYARKPVDLPEAFERKIAITKARMSPQDVVLDIGCGTGSLALRLAPCGGHLHGLDVSSEMIRIARGKAEAQRADDVTFHVGAFDTFDLFEPGSLDGICAYSILHLVDDPRAALDKIFRLLRPGGFFVSSTVCLADGWVPYRPILTVMRWVGKAPMVKILRRRDLLADIEAAGFVGIELPEVGAKPTTAFVVATKPV